MEEAKSSETINRFLDILYGAVPYAHGALIILARLSDNAEHLDDSIVRRVRGACTQVKEMLATLEPPFMYQVLDFDGA